MKINVYRTDLVASFLGQTRFKTEKFLKNHTGYTFIFKEPLAYSKNDPFGEEALKTLIILKDKYLVTIHKNSKLIL